MKTELLLSLRTEHTSEEDEGILKLVDFRRLYLCKHSLLWVVLDHYLAPQDSKQATHALLTWRRNLYLCICPWWEIRSCLWNPIKGRSFGIVSPEWWLRHLSPLGGEVAPCKGLRANYTNTQTGRQGSRCPELTEPWWKRRAYDQLGRR